MKDSKAWKIVESNDFDAAIKELTDDEIVGLLKWHDSKLGELFDAGVEERIIEEVGGFSCDGIDYRMQGAISSGRAHFEDVKAGKDIPSEDEGAITYALYDLAEERGIDEDLIYG